MGLDITVYQNLKKATIEDYDVKIYVLEESWKDRVKNFEYDQYYSGDAVYSFGYGYSSHGDFRDKLTQLTGKNLNWRTETEKEPSAFHELINFADNEGCLDWETSAKLYKDFVAYDLRAIEFFDDNTLYCYNEWKNIFYHAMQNKGLVDFH